MKKNITINLCGRLYNIDEDAYELLRNYIDSLRSYFSRQQGGEEIADDIEERIAELLDELKEQGSEAVTIENVQSIIQRVGNPDEMDGEGADNAREEAEATAERAGGESEEKKSFLSKRLYRNQEDKKLMGVLSGIATWLGVEPFFCRLAVVCFSLFCWFLPLHRLFWLIVLAYIVMAILMPAAETPEERLRMKGRQVNPKNLGEELKESSERKSSPRQNSSFISVFFTVIGTLIRWFIYFLGAMFALSCIGALIGLVAFYFFPTLLGVPFFSSVEFQTLLPDIRIPLIIFTIASGTALLLTIYSIIHSLLSEFGLLEKMGYAQRVMILVIWCILFIVSLITGAMSFARVAKDHENWSKKLEMMVEEAERSGNMHNGIYIKEYEWNFLQEQGWNILNAEGCNDRFTSCGEYYIDGQEGNRYLDCYDHRHRQRYRAERTDTLMPGRYKLTVAARANGNGAFVYTLIDGKKELIEIPATGNTGGSIWAEAKAKRDSLMNRVKSTDGTTTSLAIVNDEQGFGWNRIVISPIVINTTTAVKYGVTTESKFTGKTWLGEWFSACDFIIEEL